MQMRQTLADRARVLGVIHPHTLASRDSLGLALDGMGEHAEAVRLHRQTLDDRIRVLAPNTTSPCSAATISPGSVHENGFWLAFREARTLSDG